MQNKSSHLTFAALGSREGDPKVLRNLPRYEKMRAWEADPVAMELIATRFWRRVKRLDTHPNCWLWTNRYGEPFDWYGCFRICGQGWLSHRISFWLSRGWLNEDFQVCHYCDNPPCVNPTHLFQGTEMDNQLDYYWKGKYYRARTKIDPGIAKEIREAWIPNVVSTPMLGRIYGLSPGQIWRIAKGLAWRLSL